MKFTDAAIKAMKPKSDRYEVYEGDGFGIRVTPNGKRTFVFRYKLHGRPRRMTLGPYGHGGISLKEARNRWYAARAKLEHGTDPGQAQIEEKRANYEAGTVGELANDYMTKHAKAKKRSWIEDQRIINREVLPAWKNRKAKSIKRRDVIELLDRIVDRGAPIRANRVFEVIRRMFRFGVERDYLETTPCLYISKPAPEQRRDRVLSPEEIRTVWIKVEEIPSARPVQLALRLLLATGQRRAEVAGIEKDELDLESRWWTIPAERTKNGKIHRVPLNDYATACISELLELSEGSPHLFPATRAEGAIDPNTLTKAVGKYQEIFGLPHWRTHDLRRSFITHMRGDPKCRQYVPLVVNHTESDITSQAYDRFAYDDQKRAVMDAWQAKLEAIIEGKQSNVVQAAFK